MSSSSPVVVVGGSVSGMAAAARLAKAGHLVELHERSAQLGGRWRARPDPELGPLDSAPGVLAFPAPWRDLFKKSGRALEVELARTGHALVPAGGTRYRFADGSTLLLPAERGAQFATLEAAFGRRVAERWRNLLDGLDAVWLRLRPLGLEAELRGPRQLTRAVRAALWADRTLADLAATLGRPELAAVVRSLAARHGSVPERTPAFVAAELAASRTFGHWTVGVDDPARHPYDAGRGSVLVESLAARLALRRVDVRLGSAVLGLRVTDGRVDGEVTAEGVRPAAAVVAAVDPWSLAGGLLPPSGGRRLRRRMGRLRPLRPAAAPVVTHRLEPRTGPPEETVLLTDDGPPVVEWSRPVPEGTLVSRHALAAGPPDPSWGAAWDGVAGWTRRLPVSGLLPGLAVAGATSPAGAGASAVVLSGALASYAVHDALSSGAGDAVAGRSAGVRRGAARPP